MVGVNEAHPFQMQANKPNWSFVRYKLTPDNLQFGLYPNRERQLCDVDKDAISKQHIF